VSCDEPTSASKNELAGAATIGGFVFDEACQARLSSILHRFCGTHSFHNFTVKVQMMVQTCKSCQACTYLRSEANNVSAIRN
jgi:tRNA U38,U39,U40 pseudouridine synthase TruA